MKCICEEFYLSPTPSPTASCIYCNNEDKNIFYVNEADALKNYQLQQDRIEEELIIPA